MTKSRAEEKVFVYMNRGDIESECERLGLNVKKRSDMEMALIKAYTTEGEKDDEKT